MSRPVGGAFFSATALGAFLRAGLFVPAFVGWRSGIRLVAPPAMLSSLWSLPLADDAPCASPVSPPAARCVLPAVARARRLAPSATALLDVRCLGSPNETSRLAGFPLPTSAEPAFVGNPPYDITHREPKMTGGRRGLIAAPVNPC